MAPAPIVSKNQQRFEVTPIGTVESPLIRVRVRNLEVVDGTPIVRREAGPQQRHQRGAVAAPALHEAAGARQTPAANEEQQQPRRTLTARHPSRKSGSRRWQRIGPRLLISSNVAAPDANACLLNRGGWI